MRVQWVHNEPFRRHGEDVLWWDEGKVIYVRYGLLLLPFPFRRNNVSCL